MAMILRFGQLFLTHFFIHVTVLNYEL